MINPWPAHGIPDSPGALYGPFIGLLEQQGPDQARDCCLVGKDADHVGPALDLAVQALEWVDRMQLGPVGCREAHIGQHVGLAVVHQRGELGQRRSELVGDLAPLQPGGVGVILGEGRGDEGGHDPPPVLAGPPAPEALALAGTDRARCARWARALRAK
jgi:hypothetical protein